MYEDSRGCLHSVKGPFPAKEILISENHKNVFRGMHLSPYAKFIYVSKGSIRDFVWGDVLHERVLKAGDSLYVPGGCPHGFLSLENSELVYLLEDYFDPLRDRNIHWQTPEYGISLSNEVIISEKDSRAAYATAYDYLVIGSRGFLGQNCVKYLDKRVLESNIRLEDHEGIRNLIKRSGVKYVICAAGISGRPTIDWCEEHEDETYRVNFLEILNLIEICKDVHLTIFGSGAIYSGSKDVYTEEDLPDFIEKVYSKWRCALEKHVNKPNVLYLRIMYPCSFDGHPKCFYSKMRARQGSVDDANVSITPIPYMFPHLSKLLENKVSGIFNFVSEGAAPLGVLAGSSPVHSAEKPRGNYTLSTDKLSSFIPVIKTSVVLQERCES
jgi:dTDP-4-dehydrorhamnose reductase/dTDP-4-dehydrorhamnose 3,5-epimerase-like enzyme